jgi:hypothetical protein
MPLDPHRAPDRGPFRFQETAMTQKTTQRQTSSSSPVVPVVLFGLDDHGKPKAARFPEKQADLATKAAGLPERHEPRHQAE